MTSLKLPVVRTFWLALLGVVLVLFPFFHNWPVFGRFVTEFRTFNATMFAVWLLVVLSMNLLTGYSGQISLGHAAVVLVGAFTTAILSDRLNIPMPLAIATFALVLSLPQILKLEGLNNWTNGALGIRIHDLQPPGFVDGYLDKAEWLYYMTMGTAVFMTVVFWNLTHSRVGRAFTALRDSEIGAEQMGVNVPLYKALAFGLSSFYAGIAGGMFFMVQAFVGPESLGFFESILFLVAIVIGGLGTVLGSVFGALFLTFQAEAIDRLGDVFPEARNLRGVIYGAALVITMLLFPRGVAGAAHALLAAGPAGLWRGVRARLESLAGQAGGLAGKAGERRAARRPPGPPDRGQDGS